MTLLMKKHTYCRSNSCQKQYHQLLSISLNWTTSPGKWSHNLAQMTFPKVHVLPVHQRSCLLMSWQVFKQYRNCHRLIYTSLISDVGITRHNSKKNMQIQGSWSSQNIAAVLAPYRSLTYPAISISAENLDSPLRFVCGV